MGLFDKLFKKETQGNTGNPEKEYNELMQAMKNGTAKNAWEKMRTLSEQGCAKASYFMYTSVSANLGKAVNDQDARQMRQQANELLRRAADQGHMVAQFVVGLMTEDGCGFEKDMQVAARYYRMAAENGHSCAQQRLGNCYLNGDGVECDEKQALAWFERAAENGNPNGMLSIAYLYKDGRGVEKNYESAELWLSKTVEECNALLADAPFYKGGEGRSNYARYHVNLSYPEEQQELRDTIVKAKQTLEEVWKLKQ